MEKTTDISKATDRFRSSHESALSKEYTVGFGLDPERKGNPGIIVYAMDDNLVNRNDLLRRAKSTLPSAWEGFPIYLDNRWIPTK